MSERMSKVTVDHDEIRRWAEARRAKPALVRGTGIVQLDFPGFSGQGKLDPISWEDWFDRFEESNLAVVLDEKTLVGRETVPRRTQKTKRATTTRGKRTRASGR
jgi:hypothetical protein